MPVLTTVGNTDGGADLTTSTADKIAVSKFTASSAGTLTAGHWRAWLDASGSTLAKMVVYADSSGAPGALLATSDQLTITATSESVRDFVFSGANMITLNASTDYWIGATWDDPGTPSITYSRDAIANQRLERSDITYGTPPGPFGSATGSFSGPMDVWVDLNGTTSGGGTATSPTVRNVQTAGKSSTASGSISVTKPTGLVAGDYLLGISVGDADITLASMTGPSGFATLSSQAGNATSNYPSVKIFGKVADATDAAASTFSFGFTSVGDGTTILAAITTGTFDTSVPVAVGPFTTTARTSTVLQTAPSMTGTSGGLAMWVFGTDTNNTVESYPSSPTTPSGTTRLATVQGTPHYAMAGAYYKTLSAGGAIGTATVSPTGAGTTNGWTATSVVVNPLVGAGGGGGGPTTTTMGKTSAGASFSASSADKTAVSSVVASGSGTLDAGHAHSWLSGAGTTNTKMVVYADSSGVPGAKLAESDPVAITITADAVTNYAFTAANRIAITSGTTYWVGLAWQDPGTPSLNVGRDATASARQENTAYAPNPFGTPTAQSGPVAAWVDVVTSGGSGGGGNPTAGYTLIATVPSPTLTYLDTSVAVVSGQTRGVGGIPTPAAGPNVVLATSDSSSRLNITTSGTSGSPRIYDGQGHTVGGITITANYVTVQNYNIHDASRDGVSIFGSNCTVQNCDFARIDDGGEGDINGLTIFGDGHKVLYNNAGVSDFMATGSIGGSHTDFIQTWNTSSKRSTSNLVVQGNRVVGPATSDARYVHQFVQGEGKGSTDGGGGGTGTSSGWLICDNILDFACVNQAINFLDIHNVDITRNQFNGSASKRVGTGDGSDNIRYWTDNTGSGSYGSIGVSTTSGSGPAGPGGSTGGSPVAYSYIITAVDAAGNESGGNPGGGYTGPPDSDPPTVPTNLAAIAGDRRVSLTWDPSTDTISGVAKYRVLRGGVQVGETAATTFVDIGLTNGTLYSYTVLAIDRAGNLSAQTSAVTATPTAAIVTGAPLLPGKLTGGKIEVAIAWGADLTADEATWTWTDITSKVRYDPGISCTLGRNDESSTSNPAHLTAVLDNAGDYFSLGGKSPNWPNVRRNTPIRVRVDPGDGVGGRIVMMAFADGFTPGWDSLRANTPIVTLSASGTLRRLAQGDAPVTSAYRRVMTATPTVVAYWPFEEGESATYAPAVRGGTDMVLSVDSATPTATPGRPDWNADTSFDCSAALPRWGRAYFQADVKPYTDTGASQMRMLLSIPESGLPDGTVLAHYSMTGTIHRWDLTYGITNGVEALGMYRYNASDGSLNSSDPLIAFKVNGIPGRLGLDWTQSGSNIVWTLSFTPADPAGADTAQFFRRTLSGRTCGIVSHIELNPHNADIGATVGHLTIENQVTSFFADTDALIAHAGEVATSSSGRLARLCAENGVKYASFGSGATLGDSDNMGPQLVQPLLPLLRECEASDQGQLWDGRNAGLQYTSRRARELGVVRLTIDAAAKQLAGDFSPTDDDQRNRNRATVTRLHGVTVAHEDATGPLGTAAIGIYDDAVTINNANDSMAHQYALWLVALGTTGGYRYPSVTVDLAASPTLAANVLDLIPGSRIDVTGLDTTLASFPTSSVSLIVEGIASEISPHSWTATFRCSLFEPWAVGEVAAESGDTSDMCMRLDTDGASLASTASVGATSLSVASTGVIWTTASDDFPLYLSVGGMRVRATACSGASSPQTFTVDALTTARASGLPVALWQPRRIGLGGF